MSQSIEEKAATVVSIDPGSPKPLPVALFNNRTRGSTKLINNTDETNFMEGRNSQYWFELKEPVYVSEIYVHVDGYRAYNKLNFIWKTLRDLDEHGAKSKVEDDVYIAPIYDIISAFSIKPPRQSFSEPHLENVVVYGVTLDELDDVMEKFGIIDSTKQKLANDCNALVQSANTAKVEVANIEAQKVALTTEIETLKE